MPRPDPKIRLFVEADLAAGREVALGGAQAHYLAAVMRRAAGEELRLFNGRDGEWTARIEALERRSGRAVCAGRTRPQAGEADLWLLFAPVKKARTDFIVEKATELGVARIQPVFTRFTNAERVRPERLSAIAVEAAEQCGRLAVPEIAPPVKLAEALSGWDPARRLMLCDEAGGDAPDVALRRPGPWAVLIGPEGGLAPDERAEIRTRPYAASVSLGPRVLRADTAAVAALTLWQSRLGDLSTAPAAAEAAR